MSHMGAPLYGQDFQSILADLIKAHNETEIRVTQLEKLVHYPVSTKKEIDTAVALEKNLYAPLRNDTKAVLDLAAFARRLLDPQDLGHAVTFEVRQCARRALGLREVESEDM